MLSLLYLFLLSLEKKWTKEHGNGLIFFLCFIKGDNTPLSGIYTRIFIDINSEGGDEGEEWCLWYMYVAIGLMIGVVSFTTYNRLHDVSDGDKPKKKKRKKKKSYLFSYFFIKLI